MKKRPVVLVLVVVIAAAISYVAVGEVADAVYRDGAFHGINWHAALIYRYANQTPMNYVIHAAGSSYETARVKIADWNGFLNGKNYKGRRSKGNPPYWKRELIIEEALYQINAH